MNNDDCVVNSTPCPNIRVCTTPCLYLSIVYKLAGKPKPLREKLRPPEGIEEKDYKQELTELQALKEDIRKHSIANIRDIQDLQRKAVVAMLYADMTIREVSIIMDKSERTIKRICGRP